MRKRLPYSQGKCIPDPDTKDLVTDLMQRCVGTQDTDCGAEFASVYRNWITDSNNLILGLDRFTHTVFSQGTTESFDKFYSKHKFRNLKVLAGEYSYHSYATQCRPITSVDALDARDFVIVSLPFADSGISYCYDELMQRCDELGIPVMVDCCWFGSCAEMKFDFTYSCIEQVVFSMSKTFPVGRLRIGIRFSEEENDGLSVYARDNYLNYYSQHIALGIMEQFSADCIYNKYRKQQLEICKKLDVIASPVVNLAIGIGKSWEHLNRGGIHNRLCLSDALIGIE